MQNLEVLELDVIHVAREDELASQLVEGLGFRVKGLGFRI